jgi:serine/threonine kinase 38
MLVGYPPFFSEDPKITCQKILNWRKSFVIPADANLSPAATDLIKRLVTDASKFKITIMCVLFQNIFNITFF